MPPLNLNIASVYVAPREKFNTDIYNQLINSFPGPFVIAGDFNAHSYDGDVKLKIT